MGTPPVSPHPPARAYPDGWFHLAPSAEVPPGAVVVRPLFGQEIVVFRTASGRAVATDPFCPHLGAHLGHGGSVEGETLRCPFHGFRWGADGRCAATEYPEHPEVRTRLRTWPVEERHGHLLVFRAADGRAPDWHLPPIDTEGWTEPIHQTLILRGHVQDAAENGADFGHFGAVHGYSNLREPTVEVDGPIMHSVFGFDRGSPFLDAVPVERLPGLARLHSLTTVSSVFDTLICGLGYSVTDLRVESFGLHCRVFLLSAQLDAEHFDFTIAVSADRRPHETRRGLARGMRSRAFADVFMRFMLRKIVSDVLQDREIWAHKTYLERPGLVAGDGPIGRFRTFARQFYPGGRTTLASAQGGRP